MELSASTLRLTACGASDAVTVREKGGLDFLCTGHLLPAKHVIHAVGPVWRGGRRGEPELLASCYKLSLKLALKHRLRTIAFPAISCGVYGYPLAKTVTIAVREASAAVNEHQEFENSFFACVNDDLLELYVAALGHLKP